MKKRSIKKGLAMLMTLALTAQCMLSPTSTQKVQAAAKEVRIASSSSGLDSNDYIIYDYDAVADYGADKNGNNDCTSAIQNAINAARDNGGGVVFLPAGRYKVNGTLKVHGGVTLRGEWKSPDEGGSGKGTILMASSGSGNGSGGTKNDGTAFIWLNGGACVRDLSVWYPNQNPTSPIPYPYTISGDGHTDVYNVTLYNSYNGFYNNHCSSMIIRNLYGTVMKNGIWGAYAYDVPRIEKVYFDTKYWAQSGLTGAPSGNSLTSLNNYCKANLTGLLSGEQDWGYWYDINVNYAKYAVYLTATMENSGNKVFPGNIAVSDLKTTNVDYGVYIHATSYPGFQLSYSDITADVAGVCYAPQPANTDYPGNESGTVTAKYYTDASIMVSKTTFQGKGYSYQGRNSASDHHAVNFNNCDFQTTGTNAIYMTSGNLVCNNSTFSQNGSVIKLENRVQQYVMTGNTFRNSKTIEHGSSTVADFTDKKVVPDMPDYSYDFAPNYKPATNKIYNVQSYGAKTGNDDCTNAFQNALNAAGNNGGGTVYVPAGSYTLRGSLTIPSGVELRGSFDGAHYGNSTTNGSILYVYANKDNPNGAPFIDLKENAGVRGFTIVYAEQGVTENPAVDEVVHKYPVTVRMSKKSWVRTCSINGCYDMIDCMTNVCDGFVIDDVTGAYLGYGFRLGHGTNGGYVQDFHSNCTSWSNSYRRVNKDDNFTVRQAYGAKNANWMELGDFSNVKFFSDFSILHSDGMHLIKDPYTGKCTQDMVTWGTAFDASGDGVIGESGANSKITLLNEMGVFNQHQPGYNVITEKGFTGEINIFNADVWNDNSRIVNASGGTINLVQYLSWCCFNGVVHDGGTANVYGSTWIGKSSGDWMSIIYEPGSKGKIYGNNDNNKRFRMEMQVGAIDVDMDYNGILWESQTYVPQWKYKLITVIKNNPDIDKIDKAKYANYVNTVTEAKALYYNTSSSVTCQQIRDMIDRVNAAAAGVEEKPVEQCDLIITDIKYSPSNITEGDEVQFSATIKNVGNAAAPAGTIIGVSFRVDNESTSTWSDIHNSGLEPGATVVLTANSGSGGKKTWDATLGAHTVTAHVDDAKRLDNEANTENNQLTVDFTVNEKQKAPVPTNSSLKIEGYQISHTLKGLRVLSSIEPVIGGKKVVKTGNVYGVVSAGVTDQDLVLDSENKYVKDFESTTKGLMDKQMGASATANYYAMTMTDNGATAADYNREYAVRAYAVLEDGSVLYSEYKVYTIYKVASYLYTNKKMSNYSAHSYLYNDILKVVNKDYKEVEYDWSGILFGR